MGHELMPTPLSVTTNRKWKECHMLPIVVSCPDGYVTACKEQSGCISQTSLRVCDDDTFIGFICCRQVH